MKIISPSLLNSDTYHLINETRLKSMKSTAIVINNARGALIE